MKTSNDSSVVCFPCQDVQCANTSVNYVFHPDTINHYTLSRPPLHVLVSSHHELNKLWQTSVLTDWSVIKGAQCKIAHEANDSLYKRPARWWVKKFYQDW